MSVAVPTVEPASLRAGDFITWTKSLGDFPANQGWALTYTLINRTTKLTVTAVASGADFLVSIPASTTTGYAVGQYQWMARVSKATEIYTVDQGLLTVLPNLAALTTLDFRSHARTMLEAIEAAYEGRASRIQLEMEINGRRVRELTPADLILWRNFYKSEVAKEDKAETFARLGINTRRIGVRFTRV